jgi:hypothetical protein
MGGMGDWFVGVSSIRCFVGKGHLGGGFRLWSMDRTSAPHVLPPCVFSCFRGGVRRIVKELVYRIASDDWDSRPRNGRGV